MATKSPESAGASHGPSKPSPWVVRFAPLVAAGGTVLDVAAGGGRHVLHFRSLGHPVLAIDRDVDDLAAAAGNDPAVEILAADLESAAPWPLAGRRFAAVVVTNYLYQPLLDSLAGSLDDSGLLIYETFAAGNEAFGRPRNPDFLLRPGELLNLAQGSGLRVVAYEDGIEGGAAHRRAVQRICACRGNRLRHLMAGSEGG